MPVRPGSRLAGGSAARRHRTDGASGAPPWGRRPHLLDPVLTSPRGALDGSAGTLGTVPARPLPEVIVSLSAPIGAGLLIGGLAAFAVYSSAAPLEQDAVAVSTSTPSPAATARPTVTLMAPGCEPPAVLVEGECIVTVPGSTVAVPGPGWPAQASDEEWDDDDWDDDDDHDDDDHDDDDHDDDDDDQDDRDDDDHDGDDD